MLAIIGTIRLPPEHLASARPAMERMITASRAEDGCLAYSYAEDILEPGLIRVIEPWKDQPSLDQHWTSEHLLEWRRTWSALDIGDRNLSIYDVSGARPT